ncbi:hypothetical protein CPC08DRAFT_424017 [Agrocybe pediades]|nr:hypothetical protein CPC08DRAFT_424017 [Agrocybe pediades]
MSVQDQAIGQWPAMNSSIFTSFGSDEYNTGIRHYLRRWPPNTFPLAHLISASVGARETYSRSLLSTGNGYSPRSRDGIDTLRSKLQYTQGVTVGDIGLVDPHDGLFVYLFNIFASRDDPLNELGVPEDFGPLVLDREKDVVVQPDYFPPGTVISSTGVEVTRVSEDPFEFKFVTTAREGALLVLPDDASREDLRSSAHLSKYIEKYALSWHYFTLHSSTYVLRTLAA